MIIPQKINSLLNKNQRMNALVQTALREFEPWVERSLTPFFPEYTDHGINHLECVLQASSDLISKGAWTVFTSEDAAALVLSILLHDCATHVTEDGFAFLIKDDSWKGVGEFESKPWSQLWEEFLSEASRFDERKLNAVFGDAESIRRPDVKTLNFDRRDRFLIGEFLRRHHARLAHEIALKGIPGAKAPIQFFQDEILREQGFADLTGLISRSHGMPLRSCLDYVGKKYNLRVYQKVHAPYLMALLRIADFLQIQKERAPVEVLSVRKIQSPFSEGEWRVHHSVRDVIKAVDDPEAIYIDAQPDNVETYLRLQSWISGLQAELDTSWAVLGEVYGRFGQENLDRLTLTLRRIRSSLDDVEKFSSSVDYVPVKTNFSSSNPNLLKLLVKPLYDNKAEYAFRELMQNSVDAVRELKDVASHDSNLGAYESFKTAGDADVELTIELNEEGDPIFAHIKDKGIGMSVDVIRNYYLTAGASYRTSDAWKLSHEEAGRSRVLRSGRFGVGGLAAFLIGDEIELITRHVYEPSDRGVSFRASLEADTIELRWASCPVGTYIKIKIAKSSMEAIKNMMVKRNRYQNEPNDDWDFYCLSWPKVRRQILSKASVTPLDQHWHVPNLEEKNVYPWHSFTKKDFGKVFWTYQQNAPNVVCNGIVISDGYYYHSKGFGKYIDDPFAGYMTFPRISVFDPDGKLPVNLQRTDLTGGTLPFENEIFDSVVSDLFAHALLSAPKKPIGLSEESHWYVGTHPSLINRSYSNSSWGHWVSMKNGAALLDLALLRRLGVKRIVMGQQLTSSSKADSSWGLGDGIKEFLKDDTALGAFQPMGLGKEEMVRRFRWFFTTGNAAPWYLKDFPLVGEEIISKRVLFSEKIKKMALANDNLPKYIKEIISGASKFSNGWFQLEQPNFKPARADYKKICSGASPNGAPDLYLEFQLRNMPKLPTSALVERWFKIFEDVLPYGEAARRKILLKHKRTLTKYVEQQRVHLRESLNE